MFTSLARMTRLSAFPFFFSLLVMSFAPGAYAQIGSSGIDPDPSSGMRQGRNTIVGQVLYPSGQQIERRCTVRLSSVVVGEFSTMTDDNGVFTFHRLREGSYFITVEAGKDYLPTSEIVNLFGNSGHTETVQIQLRPRPAAGSKASVVNAALAGVPRAAVDLYQQGMALAAAGDYAKAIEQFKGAVAKYPQFVQALNELSAAYMNLGDLANAGAAIATALKYQPDSPVLRLNYGYVLLLEEKFVDAERELRLAVQLKDNSVNAHLSLGRVLIKLGKFDEAEKELTRALVLGGDSVPMAYRYLGALYSERGETAKAIDALEKYSKLSPNAKDAYRFLGDLYAARGETAKAIDALEKYLKLSPDAKDAEKVRALITQLREQSTTKKN